MKYKIVHIVSNEKFIEPFIQLINGNFNSSEHLFLNISNSNRERFPLSERDNVIEFELDLNDFKNFILLWKLVGSYLKNANKIIVHGAFTGNFNKYLYLNPSLLPKAYWVMWGADLYQPLISPAKTWKEKIHQFFDHRIKGRFTGYITYIPGDYELAKQLYGAVGNYYECIMYPSNLYSELNLPTVSNETITYIVGNSADPSNNHEEILKKLNELKDQNFNIICPLSYGSEIQAKKIKQIGKSMFGNRFTALVDFMRFDDYLKILAKVDVAVFAHERQQGMGNTITLLGLGKTVYMRSDITPFKMLNDIGVKVLDINGLDSCLLEHDEVKSNIAKIKGYYSKDNLIRQWKKVFDTL
jgi:dTDP-N-acetylfucosamine:lipid II N-acetylfucosaminyltransferase